MRKHILYNTGEPDAPEQIKDRNNEVVLQMCRVCGQAENQLEDTCPGRNPVKSEILEQSEGFIRGRISMERHPDDVSTHGGQQIPKNEWFARVQKYTETVEKIHNPNSDILHEAWSAEGGAYLRLADLKELVAAVGLFGVNRSLVRFAISDFIHDELIEVAKIEGEVVTMSYGDLWDASYKIAGKIFKEKVPQVSSPDVPMVVETTEGENVFLEQARYVIRAHAVRNKDNPTLASALNKLAEACRRAAIRAERPSKREEDLEEALDLALRMLVKYEPEDSRAVSNEYVAMAALISGIEPNEPGGEMQIIRAARERMIKESNDV